jgi:hypothetical protein
MWKALTQSIGALWVGPKWAGQTDRAKEKPRREARARKALTLSSR